MSICLADSGVLGKGDDCDEDVVISSSSRSEGGSMSMSLESSLEEVVVDL